MVGASLLPLHTLLLHCHCSGGNTLREEEVKEEEEREVEGEEKGEEGKGELEVEEEEGRKKKKGGYTSKKVQLEGMHFLY